MRCAAQRLAAESESVRARIAYTSWHDSRTVETGGFTFGGCLRRRHWETELTKMLFFPRLSDRTVRIPSVLRWGAPSMVLVCAIVAAVWTSSASMKLALIALAMLACLTLIVDLLMHLLFEQENRRGRNYESTATLATNPSIKGAVNRLFRHPVVDAKMSPCGPRRLMHRWHTRCASHLQDLMEMGEDLHLAMRNVTARKPPPAVGAMRGLVFTSMSGCGGNLISWLMGPSGGCERPWRSPTRSRFAMNSHWRVRVDRKCLPLRERSTDVVGVVSGVWRRRRLARRSDSIHSVTCPGTRRMHSARDV